MLDTHREFKQKNLAFYKNSDHCSPSVYSKVKTSSNGDAPPSPWLTGLRIVLALGLADLWLDFAAV